MTKKELQAEINKQAMMGMELWNKAVVVESREKMYRCNAQILNLDNHCRALVSYGTPVALFDLETGNFYDFLLYTNGYSKTSARYIAKFRDISRPLITNEFRYYPI